MDPIQIRRELLSTKVLENLSKRNITGYYAKTKEEAKAIALSLVKDGDTIGFGGSKSLDQIGFIDALKENDSLKLLIRNAFDKPEEALRISRETFFADCYFCSANAMTEDGILVNVDANSNRVAAISFGPSKVILVVGMNKIEKDEQSALMRARNIAAPINAQRFNIQTPCKTTGSCANCKSPDTICCQILTTRFSRHPNRMHVILVNDDLGF